MDSFPITKHDALQPAMPSVRLALQHVDSDDYFQQLLSVDAALEALNVSNKTLTLQLKDMDDQGLVAESEATKTYLAELKRLILRFEKLQSAARDGFNSRARLLRNHKVGIMDLPNELLVKIFDGLKWRLDDTNFFFFFDRGDHDAYKPAIQNVRLTCRRFLQLSSHLLVRRLDISPSVSSLEHLEEVMNHPEISRGERVFRIDLKYYSAAIAGDFQRFARMCIQKLRKKIRFFEIMIRDSDEGRHVCLDEEDRKDVEDGLVEARRILSSWKPFRKGIRIEEGASLDAAALALQKGHELYRELFQQQQKILQDGYFARVVAEAAARSGSEVWLSMSDTAPSPDSFSRQVEKFECGDSDLDLLADPDAFVQSSMIQTQAWCRTNSDEAGDVPQSLLYELPLAMRTAEARLAGVAVNINFPFKLNLGMSQDQLSGLSEVAEGLQSFTFRMDPYNSHGPHPSMGEVSRLYAYLGAAMGPQSVPILWLSLPTIVDRSDLDSDNDSGSEYNLGFTFPIRPLLNSPHWHRLRLVKLEHLKMQFSDLEYLMCMFQSKVRLHLTDIYLENGTWAAALDCLRSKAAWGSELLTPYGRDCRSLTNAKYSEIFGAGPHNGHISEATQYINSVEGVENPCRRGDQATEAN